MALPSDSRVGSVNMVKKSNTEAVGYIHSVSPVKQSAKGTSRYFNAIIQEQDGFVDFVCFNAEKRQQMADLETSKASICLENIQRVPSYKKTGQFDIKFGSHSKITRPNKQLSFRFEEPLSTSNTTIAEIQNLNAFQKINVECKVTDKGETGQQATRGGKELDKAIIIVADKTGSIEMAIWEKDIPFVEVGTSYTFKNVTVRLFDSVKSLTTSPDSVISKVADIGPIQMTDIEDTRITFELMVTSVSCSQTHVCGFCKKAIGTFNATLQTAKCENCSHRQRTSAIPVVRKCEIVGNLQSGERKILYMTESLIRSYFGDSNVDYIEDKLLLENTLEVQTGKSSNVVLKLLNKVGESNDRSRQQD